MRKELSPGLVALWLLLGASCGQNDQLVGEATTGGTTGGSSASSGGSAQAGAGPNAGKSSGSGGVVSSGGKAGGGASSGGTSSSGASNGGAGPAGGMNESGSPAGGTESGGSQSGGTSTGGATGGTASGGGSPTGGSDDGTGGETMCPPCAAPPEPGCEGAGPCGCGPYTCPEYTVTGPFIGANITVYIFRIDPNTDSCVEIVLQTYDQICPLAVGAHDTGDTDADWCIVDVTLTDNLQRCETFGSDQSGTILKPVGTAGNMTIDVDGQAETGGQNTAVAMDVEFVFSPTGDLPERMIVQIDCPMTGLCPLQ